LLTARDLCTRGWRLDVGEFEESSIVAEGNICPVRSVSGVLTLMPRVVEYELVTIEDAERKYVASELLAFLFYFLSRLECPVLNRPTAHCLTGPSWGPDHWRAACQRAGIRMKSLRKQAEPLFSGSRPDATTVRLSVVGSRCIGQAQPALCSSAIELARLAGVQFLSLVFAKGAKEPTLQSVQLVPDLEDRAVFEAIQEHLTS
jgi:hypothetical protein